MIIFKVTKSFPLPLSFIESRLNENGRNLITTGPWIVSLEYELGGRNQHFCSGTILNPEFIVTAAHCIPPNNQKFKIIAGKRMTSTEQRRNVWKSYVHAEYDGGISPNDIALIQLEEPLVLNLSVDQIRLPSAKTGIDSFGFAQTYGWDSHSGNVLETVTVPIINNDECRKILQAGPLIQNSTLCTGK